MESSHAGPSITNQKTCDTVPAPQNLLIRSSRPPSPSPQLTTSSLFDVPPVISPHEDDTDIPMEEEVVEEKELSTALFPPAPTGRKLCVRHQRMADEGTNLKLQHSLDLLPDEERSSIAQIWASFSASSHARRDLILRGILTMCCFTELSLLSDQLREIIRIDPFSLFPSEISLRVLAYLDAATLTRAAQVNRNWNRLANDDILWKTMCQQHIERKCTKCGWGLPFLKTKKNWPPGVGGRPTIAARPSSFSQTKRTIDELDRDIYPLESPSKRQRSNSPEPLPYTPADSPAPSGLLSPIPVPLSAPTCVTRPWKDVYHERHQVECNWRKGQYVVSTLKGHTEGVMCLQFSEDLPHPSFPVLITGSYDRTARVWNLETGKEIRTLRGHSRAIRALQFDEAKLITGSMDHTLKVWNWRNGQCVRTLEGHTDGVVCLQFDGNVLASGSVDTTVKVWNLRTGECFTLRGHRDWVNAVTIWDSKAVSADHAAEPSTSRLPDIDAGKMLFSASDDGVIRLWDLNLRQCVKQYHGHVGQVQSIKLLLSDEGCDESDGEVAPQEPDYSEIAAQFQSSVGEAEEAEEAPQPALGTIQPFNHPYTQLPSGMPGFAPVSVSLPSVPPADHPGFDSPAFEPSATYEAHDHEEEEPRKLPVQKRTGPVPILISGSLDNTIKVWDVERGQCMKTLFGHIEGVWAVDSDRLRLVSASHDRTIKVWVREQGRCLTTLVGHRGAVTCIALGDDKIISGSDDGDIKIWSFARDAKPILPSSSTLTGAASSAA